MPDIDMNDLKPAAPVQPGAAFLLLDRSGSMTQRWEETISAVNGYVEEVAKTLPDLPVTFAVFDTHGATLMDFQVLRDAVPAGTWQKVDHTVLRPRGYTPLLDATMRIIGMARASGMKKVSLAIITDGEENSSRETKIQTVREAIAKAKADEWDVVFIGADFDAFEEAGSLGIGAGTTLNTKGGSFAAAFSTHAVRTSGYTIGTRSANSDWTPEERAKASGSPPSA